MDMNSESKQRRRPLLPPRTPIRPVAETFHGKEMVDLYRWLEGDGGGNLTPEVVTWTDRQNEMTRHCLDTLPGRDSVGACLDAILDMGEMQLPSRAGSRCFFLRRRGSEKQASLYRRDLHDPVARLVLDVNAKDPSGALAIGGFLPDHAGRRLAISLFQGGDELSDLHVLDVDSGEFLPDRISGKATVSSWLPDGSGFIYSRLEDVKNPYSRLIALHRLGDDPAQDRVITRQETEGPLATTWGPAAWLSHDGRWLVMIYHTSTRANDLWVADFEHWRTTGNLSRRDILVGQDARSTARVWGDRLLVFTTWQAPRGRVVSCVLDNPTLTAGTEFIPERPDAVLEDFDLARDVIVVRYLEQAATRLRLFNRDGTGQGELPLPGIGTAATSTDQDDDTILVGFTSFHAPFSVYRCDAGSSRSLTVWEKIEAPFNADDFEVRRESTLSTDGTTVGFFVVKRKDLPEKGPHPTLLYGYGGFGLGMSPQFYGMLFPWLKAGGLFVVGNFRGGNEQGEEWHRAGMLERKERVFDDAAAVAYWLLGRMVTRTDRLAFYGRSNGGLLAGVMAVRYPNLFRAVISEVPLLDMLRYQHFLMARYWVPEYGTAEDPEQFRWLVNYSPYQNVRERIMYPAMLLTAGENDTRVHPLHARKMAASMQQATTTQSERPILLWIDRKSGHGVGKPRDLRRQEALDRLMFLFWQLAVTSRAEDMPFCYRPRR